MLVRIIRKPNPPIFNASEKGGPLLRHLNWKRFIEVIDQVGGRANNKMSLPSTDIMKQLKADIAPIGDIRDPDFQYLSQYLSFRGIGLGAQKLSRYHAVEFESEMQFDSVSLLLVHRPRHRDDGGKHRAIDTAKPPEGLNFGNFKKVHLLQERIKNDSVGLSTIAVKGF